MTASTATPRTVDFSGPKHPVTSLLLAIWAVLLAASFIPFPNWPTAPRSISWQVGSSIMLVALAWWTVWLGRNKRGAQLRWGTAFGMSLGCLGDAWALPPEGSLPIPRLLGAMILFGLGHLAYFAAFFGPTPGEN
ncbi:MAG: lysoplasmalogenase family protein, partial [Patescibacteria group bacterium]|nr:lysoplasmalogenase family protein [Patescibacteria group bacterium]